MKKLIISLFLFYAFPVWAAVTPNSPITPQTPMLTVQSWVPADSQNTYKTLYTGGTNGSKITGIWATTNDPASVVHGFNCAIKNGSTVYYGARGSLQPSQGTSLSNIGTPANILSSGNWGSLPHDIDGNAAIYLPSASWSVVCAYTDFALGTGTSIYATAMGADY